MAWWILRRRASRPLSLALAGVALIVLYGNLGASQEDAKHNGRAALNGANCFSSLRTSGQRSLRSRSACKASESPQDPERSWDLLAGQSFLRKTSLTFESETPFLTQLLSLTSLFAISGLFGLFYNGLGQLALLASPDATPALDEPTIIALECAGAVGGTLGFLALNDRRTQVLKRLDAELELGKLKFISATGMEVVRTLDEAKQQRKKVLAILGEGADYAIEAAAVYRRRWASSDVLVVCVGPDIPRQVAGPWLAQAQNPEDWYKANAKLRAASGSRELKGNGELSWILLGRGGRVQGKGGGIGEGIPDFDELLSFAGLEGDLADLPELAPVGAEDEERQNAREQILAAHDSFYEALKEGDAPRMSALFMDTGRDVMADAQRVPWQKVLSGPSDLLKVVDVDVVFTSPECDEAAITTIEVCPGPPSLFNDGGPGGLGTLLSTKRLRLDKATSSWKLISHRTIPYCRNTLSTSALRCNCNGCVLLKPGS